MTQETKLTEPVQVGLWYQTKAGAIVKIDRDISMPDSSYKGACFVANNNITYNSDGVNPFDDDDLIKCLGADPFNQVVKIDMPPINTNIDVTPNTPTLHDQVAMAALQGLLANPSYSEFNEVVIEACMTYATEFMRQKNERENG